MSEKETLDYLEKENSLHKFQDLTAVVHFTEMPISISLLQQRLCRL
jgi:hypothetical protein